MAHLNYFAVILAAVVAFAIGGVWYSVLFRAAWMRAQGLSAETIATGPKNPGARNLAIAAICQLITAFVTALLVKWVGCSGWSDGLLLGAVVWLGVPAMFGLGAAIFAGKSLVGFAVDAGYQLAVLAADGAIVGGWQ